jgi:Tol biopolymer transport system component
MRRIFAAAPMVLILAACTTSAVPSPSASPSAEPSPSVAIPETPEASPGESPPTGPAWEGHPAAGLALVQFPDPNSPASQVFVVEADGSLRQVTGASTSFNGASLPRWSPDQTQIAFLGPKVGGTGINGQIGVVNADGSGERQVAEGRDVQWSSDGTRILFGEVDDVTSEPPTMYLLDVASGELTDLGQGSMPRWLPGDEGISFLGMVELGGGAITSATFTMSLDGGEPVELARETEAAWAPDGSAVALAHEGTISLADPDGSGATELVGGYSPVWSPQSDRILIGYDTSQDGYPVLALVDLDGERLWSGAVGASPTWSPDGTRIAVEVGFPELLVQILDAASGEVLWEIAGHQPTWTQ